MSKKIFSVKFIFLSVVIVLTTGIFFSVDYAKAARVPTGTIGSAAPSCVIALGSSTCNVNFSWNTVDPIFGMTSVVTNGVISKVANNGISVALPISYDSSTYKLSHNNVQLSERTVSASCASGSVWYNVTKKCANVPDFIASSVTVPATTLIANNPIVYNFNGSVTNIGADGTYCLGGYLYTRFEVSNNGGTSSMYVTHSKSALSAPDNCAGSGESFTVRDTYQFPAPGNYSLRFCADTDTSWATYIAEANEGNNCGAWTPVIVYAPLSVSPASVSGYLGQSFDFTVIENGVNVSDNSQLQLSSDKSYISNTLGDNIVEKVRVYTNNGDISATEHTFGFNGGTANATFRGPTGQSGTTVINLTCPYCAKIDGNSNMSVDVGSSTTFNVVRNDNGGMTNDGLPITITDVATGAVTYGNDNGAILVSSNIFSNRIQYTVQAKSGAIAGKKYNINVAVRTLPTNPYNGVSGSSVGKGMVQATITTPILPDLTTGAVTPTTAEAGAAATFSATISNIGNASTGSSFYYKFQKAPDEAFSPVTDISPAKTMAALAAGGTGVASISTSFTAGETPFLRVCADSSLTITESNEGNNCGPWTAITVTVPTPPAPTVDYGSDKTINFGQSATLSWNSTNATYCIGPNIINYNSSPYKYTGPFYDPNHANLFPITLSGSWTVSPIKGTDYFLSCFGPGGEGKDITRINVNQIIPSGTLSATSCTINTRESSCPSSVSWTVSNLIVGKATAVTRNNPDNTSIFSDAFYDGSENLSRTNLSNIINHDSSIFYLYHNGVVLAQKAVTANCNTDVDKWDVSTGKCIPIGENGGNEMSGTLTPASSSCVIATRGSSCTKTLTWTTAKAVGTSAVTSATATPSPVNGNSGSQSFTIPYNPSGAILGLYNNSKLLAEATVTANCNTDVDKWDVSTGKCIPIGEGLAVPTCTSPTATNITSSSALLGGNITSDGGSKILGHGICLGKTSTPLGCQDDGAFTTGVFTQNRTGLTSNTLYYYRCFARNAVGTSYTPDATFTTGITAKPDLTASVIAPTNVIGGKSVSFSSTISNLGNASTVVKVTNLFQFGDKKGEIYDRTITTAREISANGEDHDRALISVSYTFPESKSTWQVRACADARYTGDASGTISESNEGNNCGASWTTVNVFLLGDVNNDGTITCADVDMIMQAFAGTITLTADEALRADVNGNGLVNATDAMLLSTNNNLPCMKPNITVGTINPISAVKGQNTEFSVVISNEGNTSTGTGTFNNTFWLDNNNDASRSTTIGSIGVLAGPIDAGKSQTKNITYAFPSAGTYYARLCVDNNNLFVGTVAESDESNCGGGTEAEGWQKITVTDAPTIDLTAGAITPISTVKGQSTRFSTFISNVGNTSTGTYFYNIFQVDTDTNHNTVSGSFPVSAGPIAGGGQQEVPYMYTIGYAGTYYARFCADNNALLVGTISESNSLGTGETNNCGPWTTITVGNTATIDLTASAVDQTTAVTDVAQTYTATISNNGSASTGTAFSYFFQKSLSDEFLDESIVDLQSEITNSALAAGANDTALSPSISFPEGKSYLRVCADKTDRNDTTGVISELDETNNCGSWTEIAVGQVSSCDEPITETQTLSCNPGYSGSITQTRDKTAYPDCSWGDWVMTVWDCTPTVSASCSPDNHFVCIPTTVTSTSQGEDATSYTWYCGTTLCTEYKSAGSCGSSNGGTFPSAPTSNLCDSGSPTTVIGSGPWTWDCIGSVTASCSANKGKKPGYIEN